jgi:hypothetical protein
LLVCDTAPADDVLLVEPLLVAVPVTVELPPVAVALTPPAGFAFAAPAVITTGEKPFSAVLPVNIVVTVVELTITPFDMVLGSIP